MVTAWSFVTAAIGAYLLYRGATMLIRNSQVLVRGYGVPLLAVGFTIVAIGTSLPELTVGLLAGIAGRSELVIGNILGSNLANFGLVLGLAALVWPVGIGKKDGRVELFGLILSSALLWLLSADGRLSRTDGAILVSLGLTFVWLSIRSGISRETPVDRLAAAFARPGRREKAVAAFGILAGAALLAVGAELVILGAKEIASRLGLSELFVGLTLVAIGTSLPEIVTSTVASVKRTEGIAVGNVVGSNVMNILLVLGSTVLISPTPVGTEVLRYHMPILIFVTAAVAAILRTRPKIGRVSGAVLVSGYLAYLAISAVSGSR